MSTYIFQHETMNKLKITNKENNLSEKSDSKIEYDIIPKVNDDGEIEKYINEMHKFSDKGEFSNKIVILGLSIFIVSIIIFFIFMNSSFVNSKTNVSDNKIITKNPIANSSSKIEAIKTVEPPTKIYEYLDIEVNRSSVLKKAVALNKGSQKGITVFLLSEILRSNTIAIAESTSSVEQLLKVLTSMEWKKNTDFTQLDKGDICFTTDVPKKPGIPGHAYVFMGWVTDGKTDYAYVCDGQIEEYGNILHKRNLSISTTQKDKFSFFLRK